MSLSLCVYCGSRNGDDPAHLAAAREVGRQIGLRGWQLVYGGGSTGLMGAVADAALQHGARVIGVIPHKLIQRELGHGGVSDLQVVDSMHERKHQMAMQSDAFIALPGGIGTMEEIFEVWTWRQLGYHHKALGLLNVAGYYDELLRFIDRSRTDGFLWPDVQELLRTDTDIDRLLNQLAADVLTLKAQTPPEQPEAAPGGVAPGT
ncbi:TIGR00730 family Rossman fold protein [Aquabacterium sp.]|uniref:LOG family protein n=1 Tax=Aquabacterium sp. TaxID=1872578 RepID=UPI002486DB7B|nr:TIGR00730 family Rossman fold protein [Aquabacterium sp.]MDI1349334.1 TIGR00730 family Rossman fold protein [Aquabacterium sp.]